VIQANVSFLFPKICSFLSEPQVKFSLDPKHFLHPNCAFAVVVVVVAVVVDCVVVGWLVVDMHNGSFQVEIIDRRIEASSKFGSRRRSVADHEGKKEMPNEDSCQFHPWTSTKENSETKKNPRKVDPLEGNPEKAAHRIWILP